MLILCLYYAVSAVGLAFIKGYHKMPRKEVSAKKFFYLTNVITASQLAFYPAFLLY